MLSSVVKASQGAGARTDGVNTLYSCCSSGELVSALWWHTIIITPKQHVPSAPLFPPTQANLIG